MGHATQLVGALVGLVAFVWVAEWAPVLEVAVCLVGAAAALKFVHPEKIRIDPPDLEVRRWRAHRRFLRPRSTRFKYRRTGSLSRYFALARAARTSGPFSSTPATGPPLPACSPCWKIQSWEQTSEGIVVSHATVRQRGFLRRRGPIELKGPFATKPSSARLHRQRGNRTSRHM